jgi:GntR family transcriptional regulator, transcriptional repressor for pyruvate dehydrogenase complex
MELVGPVGEASEGGAAAATRSEAIHRALRRGILDGTYAPDTALPSERQLSDDLGASRHAVREALKRLQQAGLVAIAQGGATRVRDWRHHGGLDLLLALGAEGEAPPEGLGLVTAMFEMRASVGADAARLAARRATPAQRAELVARAAELSGLDDLDARTAVYDVIWDTIIDASGNLAYRLALNTLVAGQAVLSFSAAVVGAEVADAPAIATLADTINNADDTAAFDAARALLVRSIPQGEV